MGINSKQDGVYPRTPFALEQKYNYSKVFNSLTEVQLAFAKQDAEVKAELSLKLGRNEKDEVVSMLNESADIITIKGDRLTIESKYFNLSADGTVTAKKFAMEGGSIDLEIERGDRVCALEYGLFGVASSDYNLLARAAGGCFLGIASNGFVFSGANAEGMVSTSPITFDNTNGHTLNGDWNIPNFVSKKAKIGKWTINDNSIKYEDDTGGWLEIAPGGISASTINGATILWSRLYNLINS